MADMWNVNQQLEQLAQGQEALTKRMETMVLGSGNATGGQANSDRYRHLKIDLPIFEGKNPDSWVFKVELIFQFYHFTDKECVEAAILSLEGHALNWFTWANRQKAVATWDELKALVLRRFRPVGESLFQRWLAVEQTGTVKEYVHRYIELAAPLEGLMDEMQLVVFMNGLKPTISAEMGMFDPKDIVRAMELAQMIEQKHKRCGPGI